MATGTVSHAKAAIFVYTVPTELQVTAGDGISEAKWAPVEQVRTEMQQGSNLLDTAGFVMSRAFYVTAGPLWHVVGGQLIMNAAHRAPEDARLIEQESRRVASEAIRDEYKEQQHDYQLERVAAAPDEPAAKKYNVTLYRKILQKAVCVSTAVSAEAALDSAMKSLANIQPDSDGHGDVWQPYDVEFDPAYPGTADRYDLPAAKKAKTEVAEQTEQTGGGGGGSEPVTAEQILEAVKKTKEHRK